MALALVLLAFWVFGFVMFHIAGAIILRRLLAAVLVFPWRRIAGRGAASRV